MIVLPAPVAETSVPASRAARSLDRAVAELESATILCGGRGDAVIRKRHVQSVAGNAAARAGGQQQRRVDPPLGMVIEEVGLNSISPPFNASTRGWPKPFGQLRVTPFAMIVALSAIIAMAPPPVFPTTMPLAAIVAPLMAFSAIFAAFTEPFAVTMELVSAQTPVPPPLATMGPFVVTSALFVAVTAVPKPEVMLLLKTAVPPF